MRSRAPLVSFGSVAVAVAFAAACSGASTTIGVPDPPDGGGSSSSSGGSSSSSGGSSSSSGGSSSGGSSSGGSSSGGASDAGNGRIEALISITQMSEACQPPIASDPVVLVGTLTLTNGTKATVGPGAITGGAFYLPAGGKVATFTLDKNGVPAIAAGGAAVIDLTKTAGSLSPQNGCSTLTCGTQYIVEISPAGTGVPAGTKLRTNPIVIACTR